jgi:hypothetical protein
MRFSEYFGINLVQPQLDFVDVDLDLDIPLFIDPFSLGSRTDELSVQCTRDVNTFFQSVLDAIRRDDRQLAMRLLSNLREPNETRLGLSRGRPRGSGIGEKLASRLYEALRASRAVATGLIQDLSDTELLVDGVGPDKVSDLTTNIIRRHLISYTQEQCDSLRVPIEGTVASGPQWIHEENRWIEQYERLPVAGGRKILLVPKYLVRWDPSLDPREYYEHFVLNFLRKEDLERPIMHFGTTSEDGERVLTKKTLKEHYSGAKDYLLEFSLAHPEVLEEYRREKRGAAPLTNKDFLENFNPQAFAGALSTALRQIPQGTAAADQYHKFMVGLLTFLFYPNMIYPHAEFAIHDRRKRVDIRYTNAARSGLFERFSRVTRRPSSAILVECKNYTREVGNPEIDQLSGRFGDVRGWLGLLVCRQIQDRPTLIARCRDTARDQRGFMLPLDDENFHAMLRHVQNEDENAIDAHLSQLFGQITT